MRPLNSFVVRMPEAFETKKQLGDITLHIDPKWDEFGNRKMEAEVVAPPANYDTGVEPGDTLYFHHHVVIAGDGKGQLIEDDLYRVKYSENSHSTQAYAYKSKKTGEIKLLSEWIFLKPEKQEEEVVSSSGIITEIKKPEYNQFGYVLYDSDAVKELGLKAGDKVMIMKNADYSMVIDDQDVYRVHMDHIYATGF